MAKANSSTSKKACKEDGQHTNVAIVSELAPEASGVYVIVNTANGKQYYGSTNNFVTRKRCHWSALRSKSHPNPILQNAWNKYGESAFVFTIVEFVDVANLIAAEQKYLDSDRSEYNIARIAGRRSRLGVSVSEETRKRMVEARSRRPPPSPATRAIWSQQRKGRKTSDRQKRAASEAGRRRWAAIPRDPVTITCPACNEPFTVPFAIRKRKDTCSPKCAGVMISKNKRLEARIRRLSFGDQTLTVSQWSQETGIPASTIYSRIDQQGWSVEAALTTPPEAKKPARLLTFDGRTQTVFAWAKDLDTYPSLLFSRLRNGMSVEEALTRPIGHKRRKQVKTLAREQTAA